MPAATELRPSWETAGPSSDDSATAFALLSTQVAIVAYGLQVTEQLIVITGAGASYDSTGIEPRDLNWQPPLVKELFAERAAFHPILDFYPDAQTLAPDLRVATRTGSVGLETYLRDQVLRSPSAYDRRRYRAIPLYLQHLLHEVSEHYTTHPVNYDRLINGVLRSANEVIFLTLNYDTILDSRLEQHAHVRSLSDYIRPDFAWSLIKLHGSVDWARRIVGVITPPSTRPTSI